MIRRILQFKLKILAKLILRKYKPEVIGITGSIGKTSAKEAINAVLSSKFSCGRGIKNYNNEIGLPLTIIGQQSAGRSLFGWTKLLLRGYKSVFFKDKNYPKILILEMGVDHIGDMDYLLKIVQPRIGVITFIGDAHEEYFGSVDKIQTEKAKIILNLPRDGWTVLNYDNELSREVEEVSLSRVITYGFSEQADVVAQDVVFNFQTSRDLLGINFKIRYGGAIIPVFLPHAISYSAIYASLAAFALGIIYGFNGIEISQALTNFHPPKGRMNLLAGINDAYIIDDTYNASPQAVISALDVLEKIEVENASRWAVLGDMLELGEASVKLHQLVGERVAKINNLFLVTIGQQAQQIAEGALNKNPDLESNIFCFSDQKQAAKFLKTKINQDDLLLVKGSQGMRLEKLVKELMAEPKKAKELLVRQDEEWS